MGDLEGGAGFWSGGTSTLPDLTDAEIRALRDQGLTTDTSAQYGSGSFDWGGLFKSTLGVVGAVAGSAARSFFGGGPAQLQYGGNAPGGGYRFVMPRAGLTAGSGGAPGIFGSGAGGLFSNPLVLLAALGGILLLVITARR